MYTREQIQCAVQGLGYIWFEDKNNKGYDVNIVGVRNSETKGKVTNRFDDKITISYKIDGEWVLRKYRKTDDENKKEVRNQYWEKRNGRSKR